jgi:hypothetical protein
MRLKTNHIRTALLLSCFLLSTATGLAAAADKTAATLLAKDALTTPNQPATIEVLLQSNRIMGAVGLGGEPVELVQAGTVVAKSMTGGDGKAVLQFTPKGRNATVLTVRTGESPRIAPAETTLTLASWERRRPILAVEVSSLMTEATSASSPIAALTGQAALGEPLPDAADELSKVSQYYYNILYVLTNATDSSGGFEVNDRIRRWLTEHRFPAGYVLLAPAGSETLGKSLDDLHAAGWTTVKTGVGRSRAFAESFLQRRLEAVMVPEPAKSETPKKAKVAKEWKEVRKKL